MEPTARSYICDLSPYQPGMPIAQLAREYKLNPDGIIKLASNENPLGMGEAVHLAITEAMNDAHRYPEQHSLLEMLAKKHGLTSRQLVLGNGSNDVLDLIARTFLGAGDEAISSEYAFAVYRIATQSAGAANSIVPARDFGHNLDAMRKAITPHTKVIWIANPNNPTGTFIDSDAIQQFIESVPPEIIIVIDEAYYEYLKVSDQANTPQWLSDYQNVILVRTFSKIYGLAGLRIGYAMTSPAVADLLNRVRQPFNTNSLALAAAQAALADRKHLVRSYNANAQGREWLIDGFERLGLASLPAYGNFVTVRFADARQVHEALLGQGIIVRPLDAYGMPDYLRITVGLLKENERLLTALEQMSQAGTLSGRSRHTSDAH